MNKHAVTLAVALLSFAINGAVCPAQAQDASATPARAIILAGGFAPDPQTISLGPNDGAIDTSTLSSGCAGSIGAAADLRLTYTADSHPLVISLTAPDQGLLVRDPSGLWYCAKGGATQASLRFARPQSGGYSIWVGGNASGAQVTISGATTE